MLFGIFLFVHISKSIFVPPFDSFSSLVANTKYDVITLKNTTPATIFMRSMKDPIPEARKMKRLSIASTIEDIHKMACFSKKKKYAIFQSDKMYKVNGDILCRLINIGDSFSKAGVVSGIVRNFKYKRTIDLG
ncbi:uncharacterized protein LOC120358214 [Solenopsis invicta]|uniref:uncharacterized protein LOC120358214 n=1 Tax=Solenopsis invicta TaxID=13686 RepID=UPI00193DF8CD|nr:uncharacterized protein LOC120358214 [Solenopsis invicta]